MATFVNTTISSLVRRPCLDLAATLEGRDFHVVTTNQDTQFVNVYLGDRMSQLQGDHRFFQCLVPFGDSA